MIFSAARPLNSPPPSATQSPSHSQLLFHRHGQRARQMRRDRIRRRQGYCGGGRGGRPAADAPRTTSSTTGSQRMRTARLAQRDQRHPAGEDQFATFISLSPLPLPFSLNGSHSHAGVHRHNHRAGNQRHLQGSGPKGAEPRGGGCDGRIVKVGAGERVAAVAVDLLVIDEDVA